MINITKLTWSFRKRALFRGVQIRLPSKGLIGVDGPSGSGKTTLFKMIMGLKPFHGIIRVNGIVLSSLTQQEMLDFRRTMFGWIDQDFTLFMELSVFENLAIIAQIKGLEQERLRRLEIHFVLKELQLGAFQHRQLKTLSGGQRQRIAFAAALIGRPPIFIGDEPFSHLDHEQEQRAFQTIQQLSKHHLVLISSHHQEVLHDYCDEIMNIQPQTQFATTQSSEMTHSFHLRSITRLPFRAVWLLIQSMKRGQSFTRVLEWLSITVLVIITTLAMVLRMVTLQIQTEIQLRLGDGLTTIVREDDGSRMQPVHIERLDQLKSINPMPTITWGVMGAMPLDAFDHQLFVRRGGQLLTMPDFNLLGFMHQVFPSEVEDISFSPMGLFEISLGLTSYQYQWAQVAFQTEDLKLYLKTHTPQLVLKTFQFDWQYEDEISFDWVDVIMTPFPMVIHPDPMFIQKLIEDHMQIPRWYDSLPSPLYIDFKPFVHVTDERDFLQLEKRLAEQQLVLDRFRFGQHIICNLDTICPLSRYFVYQLPYELPDAWLRNQPAYLPLSSGGLVRLEEALMYGFQKKMYMSSTLALLDYVQEVTFRESETRAFRVYETEGLYSSYAYAPSSSPLLWKPGIEKDGVYLSRQMLSSNPAPSMWHFLYEFHQLPLGDGFIQTTYRQASLPILGWFDAPSPSLRIHPQTYTHLMSHFLDQSVTDLFPTGFVVDDEPKDVPLPWRVSNVLAASQAQTEQWIQWIAWGSIGLGIMTMMPLMGLLLMLYDLKSEPLRHQGKILIHHGLSKETLVHVFQLETFLFFLTWWFPILIGLLGISFLLTFILGDLFSFPITYIPWIELAGVTFSLFILSRVITHRFQNQLKHN